MTYVLIAHSTPNFMVIGCGGTGGFVAEGLCRLLTGKNNRIYLIDHDRVEERNLGRQNFYPADLGRFKAEALAERLSRNYRRRIDYEVLPVEQLPWEDRADINIGCVDNPAARERLQVCGHKSMSHVPYSYGHFGGWYLDAGNGEHSGQVLIGNSLMREAKKGFFPNTGGCVGLPLPTIQQPALLAPETRPAAPSCAELVAADEQSPVINQMMAGLVLTFVNNLLSGTLSWMGAYIDLESGSLSTVDATPENVSRMTGFTVRQLEYRPRGTRV